MLKVFKFPEGLHDPSIQKWGTRQITIVLKRWRVGQNILNFGEKGWLIFSAFFSLGRITKLFKNKFLKVESKMGLIF